MHLTKDMDFNLRSRIRMKVERLFSVGLVQESIIGEIVHNIRVVYHISTMLRRHRQWEMLGRVFLGSIQRWITSRQIIMHLSLRWMVSFCDQVVSILIDPGYNYSYVNHDLVDKCGLNKEVHVESCQCSWLQVQQSGFIIG